jgi:outer membrane protein OmpA-like peptidoglycan-associated protein
MRAWTCSDHTPRLAHRALARVAAPLLCAELAVGVVRLLDPLNGLGCAYASSVTIAPIAVSVVNQVPAGHKPQLKLTVAQPLVSLAVRLQRVEDGATFAIDRTAVGRGPLSLPIGDGKGGHFTWTGQLDATLRGGGSYHFDLQFQTATAGDLKISYRRDRLDLDAHRLEFQLSRPAGRATLKVWTDDGELVAESSATFAGQPPGSWLPIDWSPRRPGNVLRLELRAESQDGLASVVTLLPWSLQIPHEEVAFESGRAEVRATEEPKLDKSYGLIVDAVTRARKADPNLPVRVYIAGHTDTVGASDDNRRLSGDRARAIASWFRDRGLPVPVSYAGFGEEALKVKTGDSVAEAQNRRVDYFLAVEEPLVARGVRAEWRPL